MMKDSKINWTESAAFKNETEPKILKLQAKLDEKIYFRSKNGRKIMKIYAKLEGKV